MEILSVGKLPSEKEYTTTCGSCHTRFKFKRGEASYHSDQRDGDYLLIRCPLAGCGKNATVQVNQGLSYGSY